MVIAREEESLAEHLIVAPEYPSPVSVLDCAVDRDDSPSPMKRITRIFTGNTPCIEKIHACGQEAELTLKYRSRIKLRNVCSTKLQN